MDNLINAGVSLWNQIENLDLFSFLLGIILSAVVGTWLNFFVTRPKLKVNGGGGGGGPGPGFYQNNISITNEPALLGLRIKGTTLFGIRLYHDFDIGQIIDRNTTHECQANLFDKDTGEFIKQLWWRSKNDPSVMSRTLELQSGERGELQLFARTYIEDGSYFVYEPESAESITPKVPAKIERFDSTKEFEIRIQYQYGRKVLKIDCKVIKGFAGKFTLQTQGGGGSSF